MVDKKWTKEQVKEYVEGTRSTANDEKCLRSIVDLDDAFKEMKLDTFVMTCITTFSDQVTCLCNKTGVPLFDLERAKKIREKLDQVFQNVLSIIDEEIEENS